MAHLSWDDVLDIERSKMISRRSSNSEWEDRDDIANYLALKYGSESDYSSNKSGIKPAKKPREKYNKKYESKPLSIFDMDHAPAIFGVVPPPNNLKTVYVERYAKRLADKYVELAVDAMIIYDIQDEKGRNGKERPFPFRERFSSMEFVNLLQKHLPDDAKLILYQAITDQHLEQCHIDGNPPLVSIINECYYSRNIRYLVWVGMSKALSVDEATELTKATCPDIIIGGVTIPERHRDRHDEDERIMKRIDAGMDFVTSQIIYNADNMITFLKDYWVLCQEKHQPPRGVILAFAPFGRKDTLEFMQWLGVEISAGTANRVVSRETTEKAIEESIEICLEIFNTIKHTCKRNNIDIPLGITVESVSKYKDEQAAAEKLFTLLKRELSV